MTIIKIKNNNYQNKKALWKERFVLYVKKLSPLGWLN